MSLALLLRFGEHSNAANSLILAICLLLGFLSFNLFFKLPECLVLGRNFFNQQLSLCKYFWAEKATNNSVFHPCLCLGSLAQRSLAAWSVVTYP